MKTELKQEILSAFNERIEAIVDGQLSGVFFVEEAIELAKAEEAVERILNIPHNEQGLVDEYLHGFTQIDGIKCEEPADAYLFHLINVDPSDFFFRLDRRIDETLGVLLAAVPDNEEIDTDPGKLMKQIVKYVFREMGFGIGTGGKIINRDKPEDLLRAAVVPDDFDSIPF